MKRILLMMLAMLAFGVHDIQAQDAPLKIVTNHPDFKINVKRCAASGKTVILDLILTNEGANDVDRVIAFGGQPGNSDEISAEAYDDQGNIYQGYCIKVKVANRSEYSMRNTGYFSILTGVPMRLSVSIEGVPANAESISRLKMGIYCSAWNLNESKPILFRNIPISRD
jgi:hypothetical protein